MCVLGSYIKRRGNLLLLGEDASRIPTRELEYCIRESLENLRLGQVFTSFSCSCRSSLPLEHIVAAYDFFEQMMEQLLDDMTAMMVNLTCSDMGIRMNIQIGCKVDIAQQVLSDVTVPVGQFTYECMDEDVVMDFVVSAGETVVC